MTIEVTYYTGSQNLNMYGVPISSETVTASATSAQSGATPTNARIIRIRAKADDRYAYGANPTATAAAGASGHFIGSGDIIDIDAVPGNKLAVITAA
jgi:hypothetical protein